MRTTSVILVIAALFTASCTQQPAAPSDPATISPSSTAAPTDLHPATTTSPVPSPSAAARSWVDAGTMTTPRGTPHAVLLGDGRVLVSGNDELGCLRPDTALTETWDPARGSWLAGPSLPKARGEFDMVALRDGRALVSGGINAGDPGAVDSQQAYSSAYLVAPVPDATWTKTGQLQTARVNPTAVVLQDGRVLIAGGEFLDARTGLLERPCGVVSAVYHPGGSAVPQAPVADVEPQRPVPALATAELYDPATGEWSSTGPMHYARLGASAVTLDDGRVLIVGSREGSDWNYTQPTLAAKAFTTAEIYDPATGRFTLTDPMPAIDWSPVADLKVTNPAPRGTGGTWSIDPSGSLVALPDGGALWIDRPVEWLAGTDDEPFEGRTLRTLRLDAATGAWTVIDDRIWVHSAKGEIPDPMHEVVAGHTRDRAMTARLADGRILIAGGYDGVTITPSTAADVYDPATNTWTALPPMPEGRAEAAPVVLRDGSILLVGGTGNGSTCPLESCECGEGTTGLATAVRFIP